jgi:hypothetical protein
VYQSTHIELGEFYDGGKCFIVLDGETFFGTYRNNELFDFGWGGRGEFNLGTRFFDVQNEFAVLFVSDEDDGEKFFRFVFLEDLGHGVFFAGQGDGFRVIDQNGGVPVDVQFVDALKVLVGFEVW